MRTNIPDEFIAALRAGRYKPRDFVRFVVRDWETSAPVADGYWSDVYPINADVIDLETGEIVNYGFAAANSLISISNIVLVSNLTVQTVTITLSQVAQRVNDLLRGYDCKQGKVQIWRGLFDPSNNTMIGPAIPRFNGTIDTAPVTTPKENDPSGSVALTCTSNVQELLRANSDTRSNESQQLRAPGDDFYKDTAVVSSWPMFWGQHNDVVQTTAAKIPGVPT